MNQKCNKTTTKNLKIFIGASPQFWGERKSAPSKGGANFRPLCSPDRESVQIWIDLKIKEIARGGDKHRQIGGIEYPRHFGATRSISPGSSFLPSVAK